MTGTFGLCGNLNVDLRTNSGTVVATSPSPPLTGTLSVTDECTMSSQVTILSFTFEEVRAHALYVTLVYCVVDYYRCDSHNVGVDTR